LDEIDFKILKVLDKDCRISNSNVARQLGFSPNSITDRINNLVEVGVIEKFSLAFNCHRIGFRRYIGTIPPPQSDIFPELKKMPEIDYVWENFDGSITFDFLCRDPKHLEQILTHLSTNGIDLGEYTELRMHLSSDIPFAQVDWRLVYHLFNNSRISQKEIAADLGINEKTVLRRLQRMYSMRLVEFSPSINFERITGYITGVLAITTKGDSKEIYLKVKEDPSITFWRNAGSVAPGFVLFLYGKNATEIHKMMQAIKNRPDVKSTYLTIIVRNWHNSDLIFETIKRMI